MFGINWSDKPKARLILSILLAAIFVFALTVAGYCVQSRYYQQAADQSAKHQRWAENEIKAQCPSFGEITPAECTYQANQAAQENERAEYDLYAQRTSALWAAIMAFAALLGIGLSGIGVWLVKATFDATKEGNNYTRIQLCPVIVFSLLRIIDSKPGREFDVRCNVQNQGQTSAINVVARLEVWTQIGEGPWLKRVVQQFEHWDAIAVAKACEFQWRWTEMDYAEVLNVRSKLTFSWRSQFSSAEMEVRYNEATYNIRGAQTPLMDPVVNPEWPELQDHRPC